MLLQICKKINIVPIILKSVFSLYLPLVYRQRELWCIGAGNVNSWQQICCLSISVYFSSLL